MSPSSGLGVAPVREFPPIRDSLRGALNVPGDLTGDPATIDTGKYDPLTQMLFPNPYVTPDTQAGRLPFDPCVEPSAGSSSSCDGSVRTTGAPGSTPDSAGVEFDDPIEDDDEFEDVPFPSQAAPPAAAPEPPPAQQTGWVGGGLAAPHTGKRTRTRRRDGKSVPTSSLPYHTYKISKRALRRQRLFYLGTSEDHAIYTTTLGAYWSDVRHFQCKQLLGLLVRRGLIPTETASNIQTEIEAVLDYLYAHPHVLMNNHSNGSSTLWVGLLAQQHTALALGRGWSVQNREDVSSLAMNRFWEGMDSSNAVQSAGAANEKSLCIKTASFDEMAARHGAVQLANLLRSTYDPARTKQVGMDPETALRATRGVRWEEPLLYSGIVEMKPPAVEENHEVP